jgi:hypothetical protein
MAGTPVAAEDPVFPPVPAARETCKDTAFCGEVIRCPPDKDHDTNCIARFTIEW